MSVEIKELNVISTIVNNPIFEQTSLIEIERIIQKMLKENESKIRKKEQGEYDR